MKKTVIKRRKRVPAAPGGSPTAQDRIMTDQAAAEVLASVGRARSAGNAEGGTGTEASDDEGDEKQPTKKRARRGKANQEKEESGDGDDEEGMGRGRKRASRGGRRASNSHQTAQQPWGDIPVTMQMQLAGHHPSDAGPSMIHDRPGSAFGGDPRYGAGAPRGNPFSPNPHGGFDLPSVNAVLGEGGSYGPPASYIRSGSAAGFAGPPSRTHSPLAGPGMNNAPSPGFVLPPPHSSIHGHAHGLSFYHPGGMSAPSGVPPIPTAPELEKHYMQLAEQKRQLEEMVERTDRMMAGVKRGLDEMKAASASPSQSQPQQQSTQPQQSPAQSPQLSAPQPQGSQAAAVPLRTDRQGGGSKESVWSIAPPESASRS
ncbi:hypothetical protein EUX98_g2136 [Antrodiella citrinella]|uniref:Uncharacterized protein n=1 Tax=Antrodiella citrinella TaxID=2447956 RepID=A0A4S4N2N1_9APHY|nr:hypothetical protein EUX98_g2136 [Antrodiella citrinella]